MRVELEIKNFLDPITSSVSGLMFWRIWLLHLGHYSKMSLVISGKKSFTGSGQYLNERVETTL
jgi:hypothetical protein